jgi:phosphoenolpyruvate phosphomutase
MRAIIIAAGRGSRLGENTDARPKCMVEVGGRSILSYQLEALRAHGVDDLHVVRGYLAERLVVDGATYHHNADWPDNNIMVSLFCAEPALEGDLLTTYSDIVYGAPVVEAALSGEADVTLVVDRRWADAYEGRHDHPVEQAELVEVDGDGRVARVGKWVGPERAVGEFIGLARFTARGAEALTRAWAELQQTQDLEGPWRHADPMRKAYLADMLEELVGRGVHVGCAFIDGGWREIDTVEDLARVGREWS